jgi:predicted RNase H-like HicB family nuclease
MTKVYPAIFHKDEDGTFWVEFPDLPGCLTDGETIEKAIANAEEVLGVYIVTRMEENLEVTSPSNIEELNTGDGFTSYVTTDIDQYRRNTKSVKKTLSIPQWLNEEAEKQHISFSAVLQSALKRELNVE